MFRTSPAKSRNGDTSYEEGYSGYESSAYADESSSYGDLSLLFEIISCRDLPAMEKGGTCNPYVKMKVGKTALYETQTVSKTLNPVFSVDVNDAVILDLSYNSLVKYGIDIKVKHRDSKGRSIVIGSVKLKEETLLLESAEAREFRLNPPRNKERQQAGYITLRWAHYFDDESDALVEGNGYDELRPLLEKNGIESDRQEEAPDRESYRKLHTLFGHNSTTIHEELVYTQPDEDRTPPMKARLNVVIEIMFCRDLVIADKISPNPYVKVKVGKRLIYQTKHLVNTLNPVFNLEEQPSEFSLIDVSPFDLDSHGGLEIKVKHKDSFGTKNDVFGTAHVTSLTLANAAGLCKEVRLSPPPGREKLSVGFIAFRCRPLTAYELSRMPAWKTPIPQAIRKVRDVLVEEREKLMPTDTSLLLEIVSCWDLPNPKRPYVKVEQRGREVHQTKPALATNEPVFTVQTDSLFFLDVLERDFVQSSGLIFRVKDMKKNRKRDDLGFVNIPGFTLATAKGERMEFELEPTEEMEELGIECKGFIAIRCRRATSYDKEFLKCLQGTDMDDIRSILGIDQGIDKLMTTKGGSSMPMIAAISGRQYKLEKNKKGEMVKLYKVRPIPDPERPIETEWMSNDQIEAEAMKESRHWLDIGSGDLGRIFLEVIGADDIMNVGSNVGGDKSDAFVTIIYEDCMVKTEVIDDCLSPRWLPWMQRAFVMRIMHTSSNIMLGLFNYHGSIGHEMLGRVAVNFANFRPNMEYLLHYNLYNDPNIAEREHRGTITLRLRLEFTDQRELILASLRGFPKDEYVNVTRRNDFAVARQVLVGKQDLSKYSLKTLRLYAEEIRSYMGLQIYLIDSVTSIALWRGRVQLFGVIPFPLNSLIFFMACALLAERPSLFPCFFVLGIAWFLHYTRRMRTRGPNPWARPRPFREMTQMLLLGKSLVRPRRIKPNQNLKAIQEFEEKTRARLRKAEVFSSVILEGRRLDKEEQKKFNLEIRQRLNEAEVAAQADGVSLDPLKPILYPIQKQVEVGIKWLRFARNVILWEEPYYAYFISTFLIALGIFFFFVPWAFILRWTMRIIAWGFFGPHMKLVDTFWYKKFKYISSEEKEKIKETLMQGVDKVIEQRRRELRIQKEEADKLRDMKAVFYGDFINKVPMLNMERYVDIPLHTSSAKPYKVTKGNHISCERVVGQQLLMSSMIPEPKTAIGALLVEQNPTEQTVRLSLTGRLHGENEVMLRE